MSKRTLFVDHAGVLGGAELYLLDVVQRMRDSSQVVLFEDGPFMQRLKEAAVPASILKAPAAVMGVERTGGRIDDLKAVPGILQMVMRLRRLARKYDVVYANSQKALIIGALAAKAAMRPMIWNLHDILTASHFSASHRKLAVSMANKMVDHVIVNSQATLDAFIEAGGDGRKATIVYNGIDASPFEAVSDEEVHAFRQSLGVQKEMLVGLFSRLTSWKGQHVLLEAIALLPDDVHAVLVGGALFQDDAAYEQELRNKAHQMGINHRVHFLGFRNDVPRLMKAVDVVVHCSTSPEPFGRVIVEGMLARKPVIAAEAGGAMEIINSGTTGLLTPPGDATTLANAILDLRLNDIFAQELADAGYEDAYRRFEIENIVNQIKNTISKVMGGNEALAIHETTASTV